MKKKILVALSASLAMLMGVSCAQNVTAKDKEKKSKTTETTREADVSDEEPDEDEVKETEVTDEEDDVVVTETTVEKDVEDDSYTTDLNVQLEPLVFEDIEFPEGLNTNTLYEFVLEYDRNTASYKGSMKATIKNCSGADWDTFVITDLTVQDATYEGMIYSEFIGPTVTINGKTTSVELTRAEDFTSLSCDLPKTVADGEVMVFETVFNVKVPRHDFNRFGWDIYDGSETVKLCNALPLVAYNDNGEWITHPFASIGESFNSETACFDVKFKCPDEYTVAMTGIPVMENGFYHVIENNIRDFAIIAITNCTTYEVEHNGVLVTVYANKPGIPNSEWAAGVICDTIDYLEENVGEYPYNSIDLCICGQGGGGMEWPELITSTDIETYNALTIAHEVTHEWFYLVVGNDEFVDPWIDEGITEYLSCRFTGDLDMDVDTIAYFEESGLTDLLNVGTNTEGDEMIYAISAYTYSAAFLNEVCVTMGDEAFFEALQDIYETYKFQQANTEGVLNIFQQHSEEDLTEIFAEYFK